MSGENHVSVSIKSVCAGAFWSHDFLCPSCLSIKHTDVLSAKMSFLKFDDKI